MKNLWMILAACLGLPGCIAVKDSVAQVDKKFLKEADEVFLKTSPVKVNPVRFNQSFLEYQIVNARQSWLANTDTKLIASNRTEVLIDSDVIDWALFGSKYPYDYSYEINNKVYQLESQSRFWFELTRKDASPINTSCGNFFIEESGVTFYKGKPSSSDIGTPSAGTAQRINTYVSCKFQDDEDSWYLSLELSRQGEPKMDFSEVPGDWKILPIQNFEQFLSNGETLSARELPFWKKIIAGFEIHYNQQLVGAISTIGKPRLWLHKTMEQEQRDKTAALLYAVFIVNDIDREWIIQSQ